jgi:hypothetical protein
MRLNRIRRWVVVSSTFHCLSKQVLIHLDNLHVALDVTSNGQLQLPPYPANPTSAIHNITIFLSSYVTGKNFTVSNGTAGASNASLGEIMAQEPSSTVKHINWMWPDCLVGDGNPDGSNSSRGAYNVNLVPILPSSSTC